MQPITIAQLQTRVAQYAATCRRRDRRLAAVFVGGLVIVAIGVALNISGCARGPVLGVDALGFGAIAGVFAYVIATTRRFHLTGRGALVRYVQARAATSVRRLTYVAADKHFSDATRSGSSSGI